MNKKQIIMLLLVMSLSVSIISIYTTFAYNEEITLLNNSTANYNLIYSLKDLSNKNISINSKDESFVDIVITNSYDVTLKYGIYYKLINSTEKAENVIVNISENSVDPLQSIIKPNETKIVSLKIKNISNNSTNLNVGALVGFEQGKIEDLQKDGEILIK